MANEQDKNIVKEYWEKAHRERLSQPLTGTKYPYLLDMFQIENIIKPGLRVLELGVGLGDCIRGFKGDRCEVHAADISESGLRNVKDLVSGAYLAPDFLGIPENYFDLISCHLVTQHMSDECILSEFPIIIKSLNTDGIMCVQFAGSDVAEENNNPNYLPTGHISLQRGRMVRTPDYAKNLIEKCGGQVVEKSTKEIKFEQKKSYWFWFKVKKI